MTRIHIDMKMSTLYLKGSTHGVGGVVVVLLTGWVVALVAVVVADGVEVGKVVVVELVGGLFEMNFKLATTPVKLPFCFIISVVVSIWFPVIENWGNCPPVLTPGRLSSTCAVPVTFFNTFDNSARSISPENEYHT